MCVYVCGGDVVAYLGTGRSDSRLCDITAQPGLRLINVFRLTNPYHFLSGEASESECVW